MTNELDFGRKAVASREKPPKQKFGRRAFLGLGVVVGTAAIGASLKRFMGGESQPPAAAAPPVNPDVLPEAVICQTRDQLPTPEQVAPSDVQQQIETALGYLNERIQGSETQAKTALINAVQQLFTSDKAMATKSRNGTIDVRIYVATQDPSRERNYRLGLSTNPNIKEQSSLLLDSAAGISPSLSSEISEDSFSQLIPDLVLEITSAGLLCYTINNGKRRNLYTNQLNETMAQIAQDLITGIPFKPSDPSI